MELIYIIFIFVFMPSHRVESINIILSRDNIILNDSYFTVLLQFIFTYLFFLFYRCITELSRLDKIKVENYVMKILWN